MIKRGSIFISCRLLMAEQKIRKSGEADGEVLFKFLPVLGTIETVDTYVLL